MTTGVLVVLMFFSFASLTDRIINWTFFLGIKSARVEKKDGGLRTQSLISFLVIVGVGKLECR